MCSKTVKSLIFTGLLLIAGTLAAQTKFIVLQDEDLNQADPCELAAQSSMVIDPATGDIAVTVVDLEECLGTTDALNVSPVLTAPSPVIAGTSLEVLWASVGAISCQPDTSGTNILPGWTNESLGLQGPKVYTVPSGASAATYNLGVSCTDGELSVTQTTQVQVSEPDLGDPPVISSFTVNGSSSSTSIEPGDTIGMSWNSPDATGCQAGGTLSSWSGSKSASGSENITNTGSLTIGDSYSVTLVCSNDAGNSSTSTRTINILDPEEPPPAECEDRPLLGQGDLTNWVRKTTGQNSCSWNRSTGQLITTADCRYFEQVWPLLWPGGTNTRNLTISGNQGRQFIAMEFNSGNIPSSHQGRMTQEVPQFAGAIGTNKLWSISKCPGDYNKDLIDAEMGPGCIKRDLFGITESFDWGGPTSSGTPRCRMQPNTRYFLNIIWTDDLPGTAPADLTPQTNCVTNRCGMNATPAGTYEP